MTINIKTAFYLNSFNKKRLKGLLYKFWNSSKKYYEFSKSLNLNFHDGKHPFHIQMINLIDNNSMVLDLGCGSAEFGKEICSKAHYVGIDLSNLALKMTEKYKIDKLNLVQGDAVNLPFKDNSFDTVLSTFSLEHFVSPKDSLLEAKRVLKKNGRLIILSEAYDNPLISPPSITFSSISHLSLRKKILSGNLKEVIRHFLNRSNYIIRQTIKQIRLLWDRKYFPFEIILDPKVIKEEFTQDNDVVYIVSIREIANFLRFTGMEIERVNYYTKSKYSLTKYFVSPLFIVARKK
ncbi:MAG: methyltransferase domain-containing protein [Candidatus Omnitrophica bacterium]|nr:methyltransferase domain-containing protein [Candidatus Omnitrophota bacterium]